MLFLFHQICLTILLSFTATLFVCLSVSSSTNKRKNVVVWLIFLLYLFAMESVEEGKCFWKVFFPREIVKTLNLCGSRLNPLIIRSKQQRIPKHTRMVHLHFYSRKKEKDTFHRQLRGHLNNLWHFFLF